MMNYFHPLLARRHGVLGSQHGLARIVCLRMPNWATGIECTVQQSSMPLPSHRRHKACLCRIYASETRGWRYTTGYVVNLCERRRLRLCLSGKQCAVCVWIVQTQWGLALTPRMLSLIHI